MFIRTILIPGLFVLSSIQGCGSTEGTKTSGLSGDASPFVCVCYEPNGNNCYINKAISEQDCDDSNANTQRGPCAFSCAFNGYSLGIVYPDAAECHTLNSVLQHGIQSLDDDKCNGCIGC